MIFFYTNISIGSTSQLRSIHHTMRIWCTTAPSALPPTKAMGAIMQSRQGLPTATPLSTSWYAGVVRFRRAMERRHCLMGCIFWAKFSRRRDSITWPNHDGRTKLDHLSWSKKSTIPQSTVGGLLMFGESAGGRNSVPVCGDGN